MDMTTNTLDAILVSECIEAIQDKETPEDKLLAAFQVAREHRLVRNPQQQVKLAVCAVIGEYPNESPEHIRLKCGWLRMVAISRSLETRNIIANMEEFEAIDAEEKAAGVEPFGLLQFIQQHCPGWFG